MDKFKSGDVVKLKTENSFSSIFIDYDKSYIVDEISYNTNLLSLRDYDYFFNAEDFIYDFVFYRKEKIFKIKESLCSKKVKE